MSKVILAILDGFGINTSNPKENAIEQADAPILKELFSAPYARLDASGEAVGIPAGQMGNSEVGHMTIGAGRTVLQGTMRIDASLTSGDFTKLPEFTKTLEHLRHEQIASRSRALHLFTLFGPGGVHASDKHLEKTLGLIPKEIPVFLHLFTDGRDLAPTSALEILKKFRSEILQNYENVSIASLSGRYFAMDRDNNYDRIEKAYKVITGDTEATTKSAEEVLAEVYASEKTDEFVEPVLLDQNGTVQDGDAVWFLNFRSDRARMMSEAFSQEKFAHFPTKSFKNLLFVSMVPYYQEYTGEAFFRDEALSDTLGEIISKAGLKQLRIAETEKFAHVTKFFNGGRFEPFNGETQKLIPSHKVATYDLDPAMSAEEITNTILKQ